MSRRFYRSKSECSTVIDGQTRSQSVSRRLTQRTAVVASFLSTICCDKVSLTQKTASRILNTQKSTFYARQVKVRESSELRSKPDKVRRPSELTKTQDSERLLLDLRCRYVNLFEEPDEANTQVRFCERLGPADTGLRHCGTIGKSVVNVENKHQPDVLEETGLLDL
jgi:hypothetical protein